jgi:hypothetical protein
MALASPDMLFLVDVAMMVTVMSLPLVRPPMVPPPALIGPLLPSAL